MNKEGGIEYTEGTYYICTFVDNCELQIFIIALLIKLIDCKENYVVAIIEKINGTIIALDSIANINSHTPLISLTFICTFSSQIVHHLSLLPHPYVSG